MFFEVLNLILGFGFICIMYSKNCLTITREMKTMIENNLYNFSFLVSSLMSISSNAGYKGMDRAFCIRMKSTLTKRGCHFKSSGYRVSSHTCFTFYLLYFHSHSLISNSFTLDIVPYKFYVE